MVIAGTLNEPGTVTISGKPAVVDATNNFRGTVATTAGSNNFTIVAKDATGNATTQQYEVDLSGFTKTFIYDANGNLKSDGARTFLWDAVDRLVGLSVGTLNTGFEYDGSGRRVRRVERLNSVVTEDVRMIWCEFALCEERPDGVVVPTRASFTNGERVSGVDTFLAADHLGSVQVTTDSSATVSGRHAFDPWGRRNLSSGTDMAKAGFTSHDWHSTSGLWLAPFRAYDAELGRWLSEDPIGLRGGPNQYAYVAGRVTSLSDPLGLKPGLKPGVRPKVSVRIKPPSTMGGALMALFWQFLDPAPVYCPSLADGEEDENEDEQREERCYEIYEEDMRICDQFASPSMRAACRSNAIERYSKCKKGGIMPPRYPVH